MNQQIHECILEAAHNEALMTSYRAVMGQIRRVRFAANLDERSERWSEVVREHEMIVEGLRRRVGEDLSSIPFNHLRNKKDAVLRNLGGQSDK